MQCFWFFSKVLCVFLWGEAGRANPLSCFLVATFVLKNEKVRVLIYTISGQLLYSIKVVEKDPISISLPNLSNGIYLINIRGDLINEASKISWVR